ncbi:C-terminal duplication domain of Friend of PRMT1 [Rhizoctonia solani]|uniref:C-terminal duplication domain of Friend of PRMT1 n=1 Tax=Rhizoctonia solani TaxID=456999 RepID=A0A8H7IKT6_9AGAM|nr:C-terminal duplication domain of Friend of PRMT1 [Rhizoctonia solani]
MPLVLSRRTMPQLPSDVWAIVLCWLVSNHGTLSLKPSTLVSRGIGREADRLLWENLKIESLGALITLSRMILARARISLHLSTLCVQTTAPDCMAFKPMDIIQVQQALMRCTKLSALELWIGPGASGVELIRELDIPSLHAFSADLMVDTHLLRFLERHPSIRELHIVLRRPVSHLKVWANYGLSQDMAIADALRLIDCMRLSTTGIVSFRFEDGPPYTPAIHQYGASFSQHMKLLGLLFIDRKSLQIIQFDNAMANQRTSSEQRDFVLRLGQAFKYLRLVSFSDLEVSSTGETRSLGQQTGGFASEGSSRTPTSPKQSGWPVGARHGPGSAEEHKARPINSTTGDESARLLVSNLHYEVTEKDLSMIFGTIGTLSCEPTIRYDRSGRSTGVANVTFTHARDAKLAQKQLDGVMAKGEAMVVKLDSPPPGSRHQPTGRNATNTLLSRMEKKPLVDRLAEGAREASKKNTNDKAGPGPGPARSVRGKGKRQEEKDPEPNLLPRLPKI